MIKRTIYITISLIIIIASLTSCKQNSYIYRKLCEEYYSQGEISTRIDYTYNKLGLLTERTTSYILMKSSTSEVYSYDGNTLASLSVTDETGKTETFKAVGDKYNQSFYYEDGTLYKVMQYDENENLIVEAFSEDNTRVFEYTYDKTGTIISVKKTMHVPSGSEKTIYYSCSYNTSAFNYILTDTQDGMKNNAYTAVYYEKINN